MEHNKLCIPQGDDRQIPLREESSMPVFQNEIPETTLMTPRELLQICTLPQIPPDLYPNITNSFISYLQLPETCLGEQEHENIFQNTYVIERATRVLSLYCSKSSPLFNLRRKETKKLANLDNKNESLLYHAHRLFAHEFLFKAVLLLIKDNKNININSIKARVKSAEAQRKMFVDAFVTQLLNVMISFITEKTAPTITVLLVLIMKSDCTEIINLLPAPFYFATQIYQKSFSFFKSFVWYIQTNKELFNFFREEMFASDFSADIPTAPGPILDLMAALSYRKSRPRSRRALIDVRLITRMAETDLAAPLLQGACFSLMAGFRGRRGELEMLGFLGDECMSRLTDLGSAESKICLLVGLSNLTRAAGSFKRLCVQESFGNLISVLGTDDARVQAAGWEVVRTLMGSQPLPFARVVFGPPFDGVFAYALSRIRRTSFCHLFRGVSAAIGRLMKADTLMVNTSIPKEIVKLGEIMVQGKFNILRAVEESIDRSAPWFNYIDSSAGIELKYVLITHQAVKKLLQSQIINL